MALLITFFLVSILASFLCSVLEAVLLSVTPMYVRAAVESGSPTGKHLAAFKKDIDKPLSAILTLNTIAHTVGAIGVGAQEGAIYGTSKISMGFAEVPVESIIATVMTLAILILSEIIPKTIGANNWEALTPFTVRTLRFLLLVLTPFVWSSQLITKSLKKEKNRSILSRADFAAMVTLGEESGTLEKGETTVIRNIMQLKKLTVNAVMTPKTVCLMADESTTLNDFYKENQPLPFSRIPIYNASRDNITGIILKNDLFQNLFEGRGDQPLSAIRRDAQFVRENLSLTEASDQLTKSRSHLAIVTDEFGAVMGLVTMEDIVETLLGVEIVDETDSVVDMRDLARELWEARQKGK
ncbi:MAG: hemolysin family protein [Bacteroidota bacterium]